MKILAVATITKAPLKYQTVYPLIVKLISVEKGPSRSLRQKIEMKLVRARAVNPGTASPVLQ
jgi:hypothetical protein